VLDAAIEHPRRLSWLRLPKPVRGVPMQSMNTDTDEINMTGESSPSGRLYVYFQKPRCPRCGSANLHGYGTQQNGDGSTTRYADCRDCRQKLLIVAE
jgi:hypothetical protein